MGWFDRQSAEDQVRLLAWWRVRQPVPQQTGRSSRKGPPLPRRRR